MSRTAPDPCLLVMRWDCVVRARGQTHAHPNAPVSPWVNSYQSIDFANSTWHLVRHSSYCHTAVPVGTFLLESRQNQFHPSVHQLVQSPSTSAPQSLPILVDWGRLGEFDRCNRRARQCIDWGESDDGAAAQGRTRAEMPLNTAWRPATGVNVKTKDLQKSKKLHSRTKRESIPLVGRRNRTHDPLQRVEPQ
jgi:hypothetical protein